MSIQPFVQPLEESIVFPQNKAAGIGFTKPAFFTFHNRFATVRTDTNHFIFHKRTRSFHGLGGVYQRGDHIVDFSHKSFWLHLATLHAQQFCFPVSSHVGGLDFFGHYGDKGFTFVGGQQHLGFLVALALQKAFCHQLFDNSRSCSRSSNALTLCILWHTVRASCFHRVQQSILGEVFRRGCLSLFQFSTRNATLALLLHIRQSSRLFLFVQQIVQHFALNAFPALVQNHLAFCGKFFPGADGGQDGFCTAVRFSHGAEQTCRNQPQDAQFPGGQS